MEWDQPNLNAGGVYSLDFRRVICCEDRIVQAQIIPDPGVSIAWKSISGRSTVGAWITWSQAGRIGLTVGIRTENGLTYARRVWTCVSSLATLLTTTPGDYAPNAYVFNEIIVPDADGNPLILG